MHLSMLFTAALALALSAPVVARPAGGVAMKVERKDYTFDYAYPAQAAAIPALKAWLDRDATKARADIAELAIPDPKLSRPVMALGHSTAWQVVTDLPGWLSLSAQRWEFTGGAHGNPWTEALLWDKAAKRRRAATDLFTSKAAFSAAIRAPFCAALDRQRAEKRGAPVNRASGDMFDECIDPLESTVILGSADGRHFTRIGVLVDPYEAGPYAEGAYEVTLPVTPAVLRAVKPQWRGAFAMGR